MAPVTRSRAVYHSLRGKPRVYWGELMGAALIASVPVAIAYKMFLDRFIADITGGAVK